MKFADHFSGHADLYTRYRPDYPEDLFAWLAGLAPGRNRAWDCATGNGQAALGLAPLFDEVIATDGSVRQLSHARRHSRVRYAVCVAEHAPLRDAAVDLVTVAQALHWFDLERFYAEVRRVTRPGAVLASWCYRLSEIGPGVDAILGPFNRDKVGPYWPGERSYVDSRYGTVPFPFDEIQAPEFRMEADWTLDHLLGYVRTWSSVRRYQAAREEDPVAGIEPALRDAWGDSGSVRRISWALGLRAGRVGAP